MLGSPRYRELSPVLRPHCSVPDITHDLDNLFFISDELLTVDELSNPVACLFSTVTTISENHPLGQLTLIIKLLNSNYNSIFRLDVFQKENLRKKPNCSFF